MCSSTDKQVAASDLALQKAQTAMTNTLNSDYSTSFTQQQEVLAQQQARLKALAANPMGYTPQQLHLATTSINENTAGAAKQALGAAAAFAGRGGAADVGSGVSGQLAGTLASQAAQQKAGELSSLNQQNESLKQQNFWNALSGLQGVGSQYGTSAGTAVGGAGSAANSAVGAGSGAVSADQAAFDNTMGIVSGIGGLVSSGANVLGDFGIGKGSTRG